MNATQLGRKVGISARVMKQHLAACGLQTPQFTRRMGTDATGQGMGRSLPLLPAWPQWTWASAGLGSTAVASAVLKVQSGRDTSSGEIRILQAAGNTLKILNGDLNVTLCLEA